MAVSPVTRPGRCAPPDGSAPRPATPPIPHLSDQVQTSAAKKDLHAISEAPNRAEAEAVLDRFVDKYGAKYDKAATGVAKDRTALLAFYDFPAEH